MKTFKFSLLICLILILALSAFSQRRFGGKVVEVIDGKTAVVEMYNGGRLTVMLQFIEIPETEQPLNQTVKDHLQKLILNKVVEINPKGIINYKTTGQVLLNGVDISRQMLRDGAAWYAVLEKSGQDEIESTDYQEQEAQARTEKRGVWSIEDMKTAWEFRAAKLEAEKAAERAKWDDLRAENDARDRARAEAKAKDLERRQTAQRNRKLNFDPRGFDNFDTKMWADIGNSGMTDSNGLIINRFPEHNAQLITTSSDFLELSSGKKSRRLECQVGYLTFQHESLGVKEFLAIACKSESDSETFKKSNQLTITTDGKKTTISKAFQLGVQADKRFQELLIFDINREFVLKIAQADKVQIKIGEFSGSISDKLHTMIKSLVLEISK